MKDTTNADLTVKATGYQWKWGYDYLNGEGEGIYFLSTLATPARPDRTGTRAASGDNYLIEVDNPLVVPVDKKVRIVTTANDVIHSWMVPAFGVKQDAIPGFVRDTWFRAEKDRRLPRPVRRTLRQGSRLHAHRGEGRVARRLQQVGRRTEEGHGRRWPTIPTRSGLRTNS